MHPLQNILGNVGDGICFMKCQNLRTGKIHTQKSWKSDAHTVVPCKTRAFRLLLWVWWIIHLQALALSLRLHEMQITPTPKYLPTFFLENFQPLVWRESINVFYKWETEVNSIAVLFFYKLFLQDQITASFVTNSRVLA